MRSHYTLKQIREAYKARNSWWGYFILHPIATRALWGVANFTPLRPETLCVLGFLVSLFALPFFLRGDPTALAWGAGFAFLSNVFDAMDGKLARLKGQVTAFGGYLDSVIDIVKHSLFIGALSIGQFQYTGAPWTLYAGLGVLTVFSIKMGNENLMGRIRAFLPPKAPTSPSPEESLLKDEGWGQWYDRINAWFAARALLPAPCGVECVTVMFIVGPLVNQVMPCLIAGSVYLVLYGLGYTLLTLKRTRGLTQGLSQDTQREKMQKIVSMAERAAMGGECGMGSSAS